MEYGIENKAECHLRPAKSPPFSLSLLPGEGRWQVGKGRGGGVVDVVGGRFILVSGDREEQEKSLAYRNQES
jgi:hypothetical protein